MLKIANCQLCSKEIIFKDKGNWSKAKRKLVNNILHCKSCAATIRNKKRWQNKEYKLKMSKISSQRAKNLWQNKEYRLKKINFTKSQWGNIEFREIQSKKSKKLWENTEYRNIVISNVKKSLNTENSKQKRSSITKILWQSEEYANSVKNSISKKWENEEYRHKKEDQPRCSSIQQILYSVLDDLNIKYYREYPDKSSDKECIIGPYSFDCVIPRNGKLDLLVECQGDYWHSLDKAIKNDRSKASYIANNFSDKYELKYLWEHEFKCKDKIYELIKYWMGITELELIDFNFKNVIIKLCPASDYKLLLSKYHYLPNAGRGGISYGAYLNNELIGVCVFSPLIRQNINISGYEQEEVRELSRLCIHPRYQKRNFTSWFVSRCIKQLDAKYKCIISYTDTTFNHDGAVYKACNFKQDSVIKPDYWYVDSAGWTMHKKTLYNHAIKLKLTESDFAAKHNYTKIYGKEKLRFIYDKSK